jgi:hypothetical protein
MEYLHRPKPKIFWSFNFRDWATKPGFEANGERIHHVHHGPSTGNEGFPRPVGGERLPEADGQHFVGAMGSPGNSAHYLSRPIL